MKKEMLINVLQPEECRIAIVEDGVLEELYVERTSHENFTGNIYKGRIVNLEPAIQAAFVDFSVGRNGFLHVSDVEPQYYRRALEDEPDPGFRDRRRHSEEPPHPARPTHAHRPEPPAEDFTDLFILDQDLPPRLEHPAPESDDPWENKLPPWGPDLDDRPERPDRSEKGRRDRSEHAFGEGLVEGWDEPPPRTRRAPTPQPDIAKPQPPTAEREAPADPVREPVSPPPTAVPAMPTFDDSDVIGWRTSTPEPSSPESDLPPSRTARPRRERSPGRVSHEDSARERDLPDAWSPALGSEPSAEQPPTRSAPRQGPPAGRDAAGRDQGRGSRRGGPREFSDVEGATPPPLPPSEQDIRFEAPLEELEDFPRKRGRDAIRARGGDRRPGRGRVPGRARPPEDREPHPSQPIEPGPPRQEAPGWGRARAQDRAGEPGYVPRRERGRQPRPPGHESETGSPQERPENADLFDPTELLGGPERPGISPYSTGDEASSTGPRRRRRRRRRAGDREGGAPETPRRRSREPREGFSEEEGAAYRAPRSEYEGARARHDDLDIDDHPLHDEDDLTLDDSSGLIDPEPRVDDEVDHELEEEIRREIEEIYALEQEMGLRGTTEARPRRGDEHGQRPDRPRGRGQFKPPIQEIFKRGDEVLVQVIKEAIGTKGPTLSTYISIPGRYLVLMPGLNRFGVSRKIADEAQRRRLRDIMQSLNPPKGLGFIVRTAGIDRTRRELARDLAYLLRLWKVILKRIKKAKAPAPIYQESDMIIRTIRDIFNGEIDTIWIDERSAYERAHDFMKVVMPRYADRVRFYDDRVPLFHRYGLEDEIAKIQRRRVDMAGGGSIVLEQTEALVAIDVNSGNFRVEDDAERTAYEMNLRAAKEIARQLRLRDLGGVIVNDFIDMRDERHRRGVERALREAVRRDRARTKVLRMSQFGIIEMTRQRIRPSLKRSVYEDCNHCSGAGVAKTAESMAIDVMRLLALAAHRSEVRRVHISVSGPVATYLNNRKRNEIAQIEQDSNLMVNLRHKEGAPAEFLQVECFDIANNEVRLMPQPPSPSRRPR